jgi:hypothetical protein
VPDRICIEPPGIEPLCIDLLRFEQHGAGHERVALREWG